jgi:hypothetical protein
MVFSLFEIERLSYSTAISAWNAVRANRTAQQMRSLYGLALGALLQSSRVRFEAQNPCVDVVKTPKTPRVVAAVRPAAHSCRMSHGWALLLPIPAVA